MVWDYIDEYTDSFFVKPCQTFFDDLVALAGKPVLIEDGSGNAVDLTGGPDLARRIFPSVTVVDASGVREVPESVVEQAVTVIVQARLTRPDGPVAPVNGAMPGAPTGQAGA